ncbi:MAG: DUF4325 domain-containing protein [Candidatus Magasanikbacteria bacterium]|nr:DUF4325 domain-containing protein [Candidatus Magasanikbacteria bacterium]
MLTQAAILEIAKKQKTLKTKDLVQKFGVSRQHASLLISGLVFQDKLIKIGSTAKARYVLPEFIKGHLEIFPTTLKKRLINKNLREHEVLETVEAQLPLLLKLPENIRSIFVFAFSEMFNNAVEHSQSAKIDIELSLKQKHLMFVINDYGIGVFKNVMRRRKLKSELEAIQDLLKGKVTTQPKSHTGEGIFFTSKSSDKFILESFGHRLTIDNTVDDVFVNDLPRSKKGTKVIFTISTESPRHLNDVFKEYTETDDDNGVPMFDKTKVRIKLYTVGGVFVSRSQARRVLTSLNKFKHIVFDFARVPMVGQAFADEVFRVFQNKHPAIMLEPINMDEPVKFMVDRTRGNNPKRRHPVSEEQS